MIRAITFDLDDTLWPVTPVIEAAERAVTDWFRETVPDHSHHFETEALRELREQAAASHPHLAHDLSELRRVSLRAACRRAGVDEALAEPAFRIFFRARNRVRLYPDVRPALARLARRHRLAALTNGNADLRLTGLSEWIGFSVSAIEAGAPKPDPRMFHHAAERLGLPPGQILHVGDDPERDVAGARAAGFRAVLLDREGRHDRRHGVPVIQHLAELNAY